MSPAVGHRNKQLMCTMNSCDPNSSQTTPLIYGSNRCSSSRSSESEDWRPVGLPQLTKPLSPKSKPYRLVEVISGHVGSVSCLALSGEFLLSASQGKDIIVWQQPDLRQFARFGQGDGSVKALITVGNRVFTAHQDSRIRVWRISKSSENMFKLVKTLPTIQDYLGNFLKESNYVETRRHHKKLWIEHADTISCLAACGDRIYSGSWDKTLKVWRMSDLRCLESIKAHDDAINGLVATKRGSGQVYSASADGKIKVWERSNDGCRHVVKATLEGHKDVSVNSVVVLESEEGLVYGGGSDGYLMGWMEDGLSSWKVVCEVKAHQMAVLCMCTKGDIVCSGSADASIGVWRKGLNGALVKLLLLTGHGAPVKCLQASPSSLGAGFLLYSGSLDKSLRVWWLSHC